MGAWKGRDMKLLLGALIGAAGLTAVAVAAAQSPAANLNPQTVAAGRALFNEKQCVKCHQAQGRGNRRLPMDGPRARVAQLSVDQIRQWLLSPEEMTAKLERKPAIPMKKVELTDAEVDALIAYMLSLRSR
jgi:mono/diheme cytochrome c family protein